MFSPTPNFLWNLELANRGTLQACNKSLLPLWSSALQMYHLQYSENTQTTCIHNKGHDYYGTFKAALSTSTYWHDTLDWVTLCGGAVWCTVGRVVTSLASTHWRPRAPLHQSKATKMSPNLAKCPQGQDCYAENHCFKEWGQRLQPAFALKPIPKCTSPRIICSFRFSLGIQSKK